jgi:hypothetical protein
MSPSVPAACRGAGLADGLADPAGDEGVGGTALRYLSRRLVGQDEQRDAGQRAVAQPLPGQAPEMS